ncbi:MAG: InlB B-repeat-containing protein [Agathobacter sp.]|nr:InlB B-repeat-containing protein [Agathobacter sp.]
MEENKDVVEEVSQSETGENQREFRGLYKHVKISVKTLDTIIVSCIVLIVILVALDLRNPGFTITFDSRGGTDVAPQNQMYGDLLEVPEDPTREGYEFTGWYLDHACDDAWEEEVDIIESDLTLYAGWEESDSE